MMIQNQMFCYNLRWIVDFYLRDGWNNNRKEKTEKGIAIIAFIVLFPSLVVVLFSSPASALEIHYGTPFVIEEHASEMCSELGRPAPTGTGWVFLMRQNSQGRTGDTYFYESQYPYTFNAAYWPPFYPGYNNYAEEIVQCGGTWVKRTDYTHIPIYAQIPPVSGFDATPQSGRAPLTVQFTDSSSGSPTSFYWEFGDNTTSTQKNPLHTYLTGGNFTVSHSATNTGGTGWRNLTGFISVENPLPLPNIYYGVPFVVLDNASDICTELRRPAPTGTGWVFLMRQYGQGRTGDTYYYDYQYPYTFNAAYWPPFYPNYSNAYVREIVQCGGTWYDRAGFTHIPIYEFPPPTANFTATPLTGPAPLTVQFNDTSTGGPTNWTWAFGDGNTSTEQNPSHTYEAAGNYTVNLTAANAAGSDTEVKEGYVSVTGGGPVVDFNASSTSVDSEVFIDFIDKSTGLPTWWNWSFGDSKTSTERYPSHNYTVGGTYTVSLTAGNDTWNNTKIKPDFISVKCQYPCDTIIEPPYLMFEIYAVSCPEDNIPWRSAVCTDNTIIRWAMAGQSSAFHSTLSPWLWKRSSCCPGPGNSWAVDTPANLPVYYAAVTNGDANVYYKDHAIAAEYLANEDPKYSTWDDWNFFQYNERNITLGPGNQIPNGTSMSNTTVTIKEIAGVYGCGQPVQIPVVSYDIDLNYHITSHPATSYAKGYMVSKTGKMQFKELDIPSDLKVVLRSMENKNGLIVSKWEFVPLSKELKIYVYNLSNSEEVDDLKGKPVNGYSVRVVHDTEFEKNIKGIQQQLIQLRKNPDYKIATTAMTIDTLNDPPQNYVDIWVYETTPENKKLENDVIQGWKVIVHPISQSLSNTPKY